MAPSYIEDLCVPITSVSTGAGLCSAARGHLVVPRIRLCLRNRAVCVAGSVAWKSPDRHLNCTNTLNFQKSTSDSIVLVVIFCRLTVNLLQVAYVVQCPCSDFMDMLWRLINCRFITIYRPGSDSASNNNRPTVYTHMPDFFSNLEGCCTSPLYR